MAATVSAWSKPGAWALDAEEHEAELLQQQKVASAVGADFPTLTTAVTTGGGKSKKKKGQTVSLAEFTTYGGPKPSEPAAAGLTHEDRMALPKGPRERTAEELDRNRLGGGFRSYGDRGGNRQSSGEWGSDKERPGGGRDSVRDSGPSRADEVDNWASAKKPLFGNGFERRDSRDGRDRGGFFDSQSKADESDNWGANKSYAPPPQATESRRFGGGRGFASNAGGGGGGADSGFWGKRRDESSNGFGSESGSARPKLNLQPRTLPVVSNGGGSPEKAAAAAPAPAPAPVSAPKPNPFGAARPREEVLAEKGQDWKKIDEQLDSMKIKEVSERAERGGSSFGKRGFGRSGSSSDHTESSWRKQESADDAAAAASTDGDASQSAEKNEDESAAET